MVAEFPKCTAIPLEFDESEVPLCRWDDGTVRVRGHRLLFEMVAGAHQAGQSAADIVDAYDTLSNEDAEAIVAFCRQHPDEVAAYLAEVDRQGRLIQAFIEERQGTSGLMDRLRARWAERNAEVPH
jgi:uncharacterized protein (DUF433 family)